MNWENFSQADLVRWCQPRIFQRGQVCYHEGHLVKACCFENVLAGKFRGGGGIYKALLWMEDGKLLWKCSCPYPDFCKHLAALGYAWLNNRSLFEEVDSLYRRVMDDVTLRERITHDLVAKNPFDFLELCQRQSGRDFVSGRAILNIVRQLFKYPQLKLADVESLWERLQGITPVIESEIEKGEIGILLPLNEVWEGLLNAYRSVPAPELKELLVQQLQLQRSLLRFFSKEKLQLFYDSLVSSYFDVLLWDLGEEIRPVLREYIESNPQWFSTILATVESCDGYLQWIRIFELLEAIPALHHRLPNITERLLSVREGRLWLIDRWMTECPEEAYRLAKRSLVKCSGEERNMFRDRLIEIHRRRLEFKQAAALSYIQLTETCEFEEYIRLKRLLEKFPDDFQNYYRRLVIELREKKMWRLLGQILLDAGQYRDFMDVISGILAEREGSVGVLEMLANWKDPAILEYPVYPTVLLPLLKQRPGRQGKSVLRLVAAYKRLCLENESRDLWEAFASEVRGGLESQFLNGRLRALLD